LDVRAMPTFMERLQRASRVYESNAPAYLRTHPVTTERIADLQNRTEVIPYKQIPDNQEFQIVRARLRANVGDPRQTVEFFEQGLKERRFISEVASHYGLALALLRAKDIARASRELSLVEQAVPGLAAVAVLRGQLLAASGDVAGALAHYVAALKVHPRYRALVYDYAELLVVNRQPEEALRILDAQLQYAPEDGRLYALQARSYAAQGKGLLQHKSLAEAYIRRGQLGAAIEQLQIAARAGDGDFYQLSSVEARLRELRAQLKAAEKDKRLQ
jgi:beta-barrel assembly-enhancing protease